MDIVVVGKHVEIPGELNEHVREKTATLVRFAADLRRVDVEFEHIAARRSDEECECVVLAHVKGRLVKGHGSAADLQRAFDRALGKTEEQMRKLHERRVDKPASRRDGGPGAHRDGGPGAYRDEEPGPPSS